MYNVFEVKSGNFGYSVQVDNKSIVQETAPALPGNLYMSETQALSLAKLTEKKIKIGKWLMQSEIQNIMDKG